MIDASRKVIREGKPNQYLYGKYANVPLTATQYLKLKKQFPDDWEERVEALSEHIEKTGKEYKDCLAAIRVRARFENRE
jgi:hypothetical protein